MGREGCSEGKGRQELVSYFPYLISSKNNKNYLKGKCSSQGSLSSGILDLAAQGRHFVSQAKNWEVWYELSMNWIPNLADSLENLLQALKPGEGNLTEGGVWTTVWEPVSGRSKRSKDKDVCPSFPGSHWLLCYLFHPVLGMQPKATHSYAKPGIFLLRGKSERVWPTAHGNNGNV